MNTFRRQEREYKPYDDYRPTDDYNNEELLRESDMAELIVIDIKPFRNVPELSHLIGAEVIINPYEDQINDCDDDSCDLPQEEPTYDVYEYP